MAHATAGMLDHYTNLPTLTLVRRPRRAWRITYLILLFLIAFPAALCLMPWTQFVYGSGQTFAFNPVQRPQFIVAPIEGRVKRWYVVPGDRVVKGQRIVELVDNAPDLERLLEQEMLAIQDRLRAADNRIREIESRIANLEQSRLAQLAFQTSVLIEIDARIMQARQEENIAQAALDAAVPNLKRTIELNKEKDRTGVPLASDRDLELAQAAFNAAEAQVKRARALIEATQASKKAAEALLQRIDEDTQAALALERAIRESAIGDVNSIKANLVSMQVRIDRQRAQYIDSPCDGVVFRLLANSEQGGILVRPGERLALIVPDIQKAEAKLIPLPEDWGAATSLQLLGDPALSSVWGTLPLMVGLAQRELVDYPHIVVELSMDGNDLPLLRKGRKVRLQFEGWPAVQFVGWPSVAVGTFGGRVYLVEPAADDKGKFRILVEPDPDDKWEWPEQFLRQGVRANGWVLLDRVSLGWELWRLLNGFPPAIVDPGTKEASVFGPVKRKEFKQ